MMAARTASLNQLMPWCILSLGDEALGLSDRDVDRIRQHADAMARTIVEIFLDQRTTSE